MADTKFKKGEPRPANAGRKKGTPNKKKLLTVEEILLKYDVNPIEELIKIAQAEDTRTDIKKDCWKEVSKYTFSQKKAIESNTTVDLQPSGFIIARA